MFDSRHHRNTLALYVVDDSAFLRRMLIDLLSLVPGIEVVGEAGSVALAISGVTETRPDVIMLDLNLPGGSGLDVLGAVRVALPDATVIIHTMHTFGEIGARCLEAGADYFFEKGGDLDPLLETLGNLVRSADREPVAVLRRADNDLQRQKVRTREELFRHTIEGNPDCIHILDLEGHFLWINNAGKTATGLGDADIARKAAWPDCYQGSHRKQATAALDAALENGLGRFTAPCAVGKGRTRWWDVWVTRMLDETGKPNKFLVVSRDITDRKASLEKISSQLDRLETRRTRTLRGRRSA